MALTVLSLAACSKLTSQPVQQAVTAAPEATIHLTILYVNGDIITVNEAQPSAEAVAVREGKILAVGSREDVEAAAGFWKYQRWPSYHTRAAKTSWFLIIVGAIGLFIDWSLWPLRIALAATTITNLEAILITIISPTWRANVTSICHAWRDSSAS